MPKVVVANRSEGSKFDLRRQSQEAVGGEDVLYTIGVERDEVDDTINREIIKRVFASGVHTWREFEDFIRKTDPAFLPTLIENTPYQRAYLFGTLNHNLSEPFAWLESMFVKKPFRSRGYATRMMGAMLKDVDKHCYDTHGKVNANEKVDDFTWKLGEGGRSEKWGTDYGIDLPVAEYNERQERLVHFYERFGFKVTEEFVGSDGRRHVRIMRPKQCEL